MTDSIPRPAATLLRLTQVKARTGLSRSTIYLRIKAGIGEDGFELWDHWSRSSARYRDTDARDVWRSLRPDRGISLATLFIEAKKHGYVQHRADKAGRPVAAPAARALAAAPGGGG